MAGKGEQVRHNVIVPGTVGTLDLQDYLHGFRPGECPDGFRISAALAMQYGLARTVGMIKDQTGEGTKVYLDHRIDSLGSVALVAELAPAVKAGAVDGVMLYPFNGRVATAHLQQLMDAGVGIIVGSPKGQGKSVRYGAGGLVDITWEETFNAPIEAGVRQFAVPSDDGPLVNRWHSYFDVAVGAGNYSVYMEGVTDRTLGMRDLFAAAGENVNVVIGSEPYEPGLSGGYIVGQTVSLARRELEMSSGR